MARRSAGCARASSISVARWVCWRRRASRSTAASSKRSIIEIAILHEGRSIAGARSSRRVWRGISPSSIRRTGRNRPTCSCSRRRGSTHEVTNTGSDRSQLANVAREAKAVLQVDKLEAVADRGYFNGEEILACEQAGICVTLPKPMTSGAKSEGRFGKQDFIYVPEEDVYRCPAGEKLKFHYANEEHGQKMRRYWTNACKTCAIKDQCTTAKERRITRWEHEHVLETVQQRLDQDPQAMRRRRETVEHPFGTLKMRMGATHFLMKTLPKVASEMALSVLAYNLTRVMNIVGTRALLAAIRA